MGTSVSPWGRAALRRDGPLLTAWAESYAAVDELGGGREAVRPCTWVGVSGFGGIRWRGRIRVDSEQPRRGKSWGILQSVWAF